MQKEEKEKKRFTEEGRLSTEEFLLYLFASSWGQQFRACNRIKQYNKQKFPRRHVGKWIETHSFGHSKENQSTLQPPIFFKFHDSSKRLTIDHLAF